MFPPLPMINQMDSGIQASQAIHQSMRRPKDASKSADAPSLGDPTWGATPALD